MRYLLRDRRLEHSALYWVQKITVAEVVSRTFFKNFISEGNKKPAGAGCRFG